MVHLLGLAPRSCGRPEHKLGQLRGALSSPEVDELGQLGKDGHQCLFNPKRDILFLNNLRFSRLHAFLAFTQILVHILTYIYCLFVETLVVIY